VELSGDAVHVASSACVTVIAQGAGTAAVARHGASMTRTTVPAGRLQGSPFVRVTVVDAAGRRAWSNPVWR
jgi:hypothetical protein